MRAALPQKRHGVLVSVATVFIKSSIRRRIRAMSLGGVIALVGFVCRSAPAAAAADGNKDFVAVFRGWCMEAPVHPAIGGNREVANDDVPRDRAELCGRLAALHARALMVYAQDYREEKARQQDQAQVDNGRRLARWRVSPLYKFADLCRQMQAIGSGRASSDGICLWGHGQLLASPFRFDRLPQKRLWEPDMMRRELSMVLVRHPPGNGRRRHACGPESGGIRVP
jgi:hypothetical protein